MGPWIEMLRSMRIKSSGTKSGPTWARGLKYLRSKELIDFLPVGPYMGPWIEMVVIDARQYSSESGPTWARGLKY